MTNVINKSIFQINPKGPKCRVQGPGCKVQRPSYKVYPQKSKVEGPFPLSMQAMCIYGTLVFLLVEKY